MRIWLATVIWKHIRVYISSAVFLLRAAIMERQCSREAELRVAISAFWSIIQKLGNGVTSPQIIMLGPSRLP